jgi:hypothetical protein
MDEPFKVGDWVRIPDGRIGRVREVTGPHCKVRVRRPTSETHQFLMFIADDLEGVVCPKGWMSPEWRSDSRGEWRTAAGLGP